MEGANESARRAVNRIIEVSGSKARKSKIWDMHEPLLLAPFRWYDRRRYRKGLAWREDFPWMARIMHFVFRMIGK